jgi:hypothetical protein
MGKGLDAAPHRVPPAPGELMGALETADEAGWLRALQQARGGTPEQLKTTTKRDGAIGGAES